MTSRVGARARRGPPWVRVGFDDFATNPRLLSLTPAERWTWLELLTFLAAHGQDDAHDGVIPPWICDGLPMVTPRFLARLVELGLIDVDAAGVMRVAGWEALNPVDPFAFERKRRQRRREASLLGGASS